jgi:hypothetical protein
VSVVVDLDDLKVQPGFCPAIVKVNVKVNVDDNG